MADADGHQDQSKEDGMVGVMRRKKNIAPVGDSAGRTARELDALHCGRLLINQMALAQLFGG